MGTTASTPKPEVPATTCPVITTNTTNDAPPVTSESKPSEGLSLRSLCPVTKKSGDSEGGSSCPISSGYKNPNVYNVYSQKLDPTNNMPSTANQQPAPNQKASLSTERVKSTIPKGGTDTDTWVYPSPQMFWNALVRKEKADDASEGDMDAVIAIHNNMNENTWHQVMLWEELHEVEGPGREPKLLKFSGRPHEYSPKAQLKMLLGHSAPFDRHDWIVDRGGKEVRYVIDYYHDESAVAEDKLPKHLKDMSSMQSIVVDVRPAIDSVESVIDRFIVMPWKQLKNETTFEAPSFFPPSKMKLAEIRERARVSNIWKDVQTKCEAEKLELSTCEDEEKRGIAALKLQKCIGSVVCPDITAEFNRCLKEYSPEDDRVSQSFDKMTNCLDEFKIDSQRIMISAKK